MTMLALPPRPGGQRPGRPAAIVHTANRHHPAEHPHHEAGEAPGLRMTHSGAALAHAVAVATADLGIRLGQVPTVAELAAYLGVNTRDLLTAIGAAQAYHLTRLNTADPNLDHPARPVAAHPGRAADDLARLAPILATFFAGQRRHLTVRFDSDVPPPAGFGDQAASTPMHVSALLHRTLVQLRADLPH